MNTAHWHLLLNHLPIEGTIFSSLLLAYGLISRNHDLKNIGLVFYILTALFAIPVLLTGNGAEDILQSIGQKNEYFIHQHEEMAKKAFWISQSIALLSIGGLIAAYRKKNYSRILIFSVLLAGILNSILMTTVGNAGGQIRHSEMRKQLVN